MRHLTYCLFTKTAVPYESLGNAPDMATMIQSLSDEKAIAIFWFASTLVEEVGKTDANSMKQCVSPVENQVA